MKLATLRKLIRHTTVPYPAIIERATKGGCKFNWNAAKDVANVTTADGNAIELIFEDASLSSLIASRY